MHLAGGQPLRRFALILCTAVLLLTASACNGGDSGSEPTTTSFGTGSTVPEAASTAGGTLRIGLVRPDTLDPAAANEGDQHEMLMADLLFDGLTDLDRATGEPVPAIATSWSTENRQLWQFEIDPSAVFADGSAITAAEVESSLERAIRATANSTLTVQLELIAGYQAFLDGGTADLIGVRADGSTVVIELTSPLSALPAVLSSPLLGIVPSAAVAADEPVFGEAPVGSGPYRLQSRDGDQLDLIRAPGNVDGLLDGLSVRFFDNRGIAYSTFEADQLDWVAVPRGAEGAAQNNYVTQVMADPFGVELFWAFNLSNPKYADVRFREAIVHAIDRESLVADIYGVTVQLVDGFLVRGVPGFEDSPCDCGFDPARSTALLQAAFAESTPPEVLIDFDSGDTQRRIAERIEADLEKVGIPATLRPKPFSSYREFAASGEQEFFRLGWIGAFNSPEAYLSPLLVSGAPDNVLTFSDSEVDQHLRTARAATGFLEAVTAYQAAEKASLAQYPIVPLGQFLNFSVRSERARDIDVEVDGTFDATKAWVADGE